MKEPDSDERRARQAQEMRIFLLGANFENAEAADQFFCGMIEEGGATWDDQKKILTVDYRHAPKGPYFAMRFTEDGMIEVIDPGKLEEGP